MAKHPAAFINVIAERRDFDEALKYLQETWDELCDLKAQMRQHNQDKPDQATAPLLGRQS